jgi:chromosome segregation ATPase
MKMKAKGKISGIHVNSCSNYLLFSPPPSLFIIYLLFSKLISQQQGRLGDLGAIDATYDVAISTACGALDHIVVETAEAGQECVQYLRDNNLGFATFILMDKMEQQYHNRMDKIALPDKAKR